MIKLNNNGLVIADLHVRKDERFSPEEGYRLKIQPLKLLERMKRLISEKNIGFIVILGDLLDTPASLPEENTVLNQMFSEMNTWNIPIYYILGQHDVNLNKYNSNDLDYSTRSNVNVLSKYYENIYYAHDEYADWNGKKVYFSNFSDPIIYPKEKVNLWLTHCSIGFVKIEENMFDLMVAGDIHDHLRVGNCYTVGTPYQHKAHEQKVGVIGFLEIKEDNINFERLPSDDENFKFLRFDSPKKEFETVDEKGNKVVVDLTSSTFNNELNRVLNERNLMNIHRKVDTTNAPNPVNLNFNFKKLIINDFRSVNEFELDFTNFRKVLFLFGPYGSGKSTIVTAIREVLIGDTKSIGENVSFWAKNCKLQLELEYEGKEYKIIRGKSLFEFYINGNLENQNSAKATEAYMRDCLPFIDYIDILIPRSGTRLFNKEIGQRLLERCINLDVFNYYREQAISLSKIYNEETSTLRNKLSIENAKLQDSFMEKERFVEELNKTKIINVDEVELNKKKKHLLEYDNELHTLRGSKESINSVLGSYNITGDINVEDLKKDIQQLESLIDSIKQNENNKILYNNINENIIELRKEYSQLVESKKKINILPTETYEELKQQKKDLLAINEEIIQFNADLQSKKVDLTRRKILAEEGIKNGSYICPTCNQKVEKDTTHLQIELQNLIKQIEELPIEKEKLDMSEVESKILIWENYNDNIEIEKKLVNIVEKGNELKTQLENIKLIDYSSYNLIELIAQRDNKQAVVFNYDKYLESKKLLENVEKSIESINQKIQWELIQGLDLKDTIKYIDEILTKIEYVNKLKSFINEKEIYINELNKTIDTIKNEIKQREEEEQKWLQYIKLMDHTDLDSLPYNLFEKLVCNFNTDKFKIMTSRTQKNKKVVYDINLMLKTNKEFWVSYQNGSGGQQLLMEIMLFDIVANFLGGIGFLALDEVTNPASDDLVSYLQEIISNMNYNKIILIGHNQRLSCFDKMLNVSIDEKGVTSYN